MMLKAAKQVRLGPPPKRNRKEWPYQGTISFRGLDILVENKAGSSREWKDENTGESGSTKMLHHYGEVRRTLGPDGDPVDVYVGPDSGSDVVYIVHQMKKPGFKEYDEDKCMLGFRTAADAKKGYLAHYDDPRFFGSMTTMSFDDFKKLLKRRDVRGKRITEALIKVGAQLFFPSVKLASPEDVVPKKQFRPAGLVGDFAAGMDPTGTWTTGLSKKTESHYPTGGAGGRHAAGYGAAVAGGLVGGGVLLPGTVSGILGASRGAAQAGGGVGQRALGAARGFTQGFAAPFRGLARGARLHGWLRGVRKGDKPMGIPEKLVGDVVDTAKGVTFGSLFRGRGTRPNNLLQDVGAKMRAGGEYSLDDVASHLYSKGYGPEQITSYMRQQGLSPEHIGYAMEKVKGLSPEQTAAWLRQKGVSEEIASNYLTSRGLAPSFITDALTARGVTPANAQKVWGQLKKITNPQEAARVLESHGLTPEQAAAILRQRGATLEGVGQRLSGSVLDVASQVRRLEQYGVSPERAGKVFQMMEGATPERAAQLLRDSGVSPENIVKVLAERGVGQRAATFAVERLGVSRDRASRMFADIHKLTPEEAARRLQKEIGGQKLTRGQIEQFVRDQVVTPEGAQGLLPITAAELTGGLASLGVGAGVGTIGAAAQYKKGVSLEREFRGRLHKDREKRGAGETVLGDPLKNAPTTGSILENQLDKLADLASTVRGIPKSERGLLNWEKGREARWEKGSTPIRYEGKVVGFHARGPAGWLGTVYIQPEYRGKGIASAHLRKFVGDKPMNSAVRADNEPSKQLLRSLGFEESRRVGKTVVMTKPTEMRKAGVAQGETVSGGSPENAPTTGSILENQLDKLGSTPMYHGSSARTRELQPRKDHGDPQVPAAVFGAVDPSFALPYAAKPWSDRDFNQSAYYKRGKRQISMREMRPGAIEDTYKGVKGYLYTLPGEGFVRTKRPGATWEKINTSPVTPTKTEVIPDALKALKADPQIELHPYDPDHPDTRKAVRRMVKRMREMDDGGKQYKRWRLKGAPREIKKLFREEMRKTAAKGIPDRKKRTDPPKLQAPQTMEFVTQLHNAKKAGPHIDLRIGDTTSGIAHSWALPKVIVPKPGEKVLAIQQPDHSIHYMDFRGLIGKGYGAGTVKAMDRLQTEVHHSEPGKMKFRLERGGGVEEFVLRRTSKKPRGTKWLLQNVTKEKTAADALAEHAANASERVLETVRRRAKLAAAPPIIPTPRHLEMAEEVVTNDSLSRDNWIDFQRRMQRSPGYRQALLLHPQADAKLKRHVRAMGALHEGTHLRKVRSLSGPKQYQLKLMTSGRLGCTCPDWRYRKSHGGGDCKHVRAFRTAFDAGEMPRGYKGLQRALEKSSAVVSAEVIQQALDQMPRVLQSVVKRYPLQTVRSAEVVNKAPSWVKALLPEGLRKQVGQAGWTADVMTRGASTADEVVGRQIKALTARRAKEYLRAATEHAMVRNPEMSIPASIKNMGFGH